MRVVIPAKVLFSPVPLTDSLILQFRIFEVKQYSAFCGFEPSRSLHKKCIVNVKSRHNVGTYKDIPSNGGVIS